MSSSSPADVGHPQPGMLATVRHRRAVIASSEPFDTPNGRLHLVRVEYTDGDPHTEDTLIWEREDGATVLPPHALPRVESDQPMAHDDFRAMVRAARWSAIAPFLAADGSGGPAGARIAAP